MILLLLLLVLVPFLVGRIVWGLVKRKYPKKYDSTREGWAIGLWVTCVVAALAVLIPVVRTMDHHFAANSCREYGRDVGREVKFMDHGFWDYDCYVKTDSGWVIRSHVFEVQS